MGTSTSRALEEAARRGWPADRWEETDLVVRPGYSFRVPRALVTNFHLPRTSVLSLAAAFAGPTMLGAAYEEAIEKGYRFGSYGDATLLR